MTAFRDWWLDLWVEWFFFAATIAFTLIGIVWLGFIVVGIACHVRDWWRGEDKP
jgi:hypothetical protein